MKRMSLGFGRKKQDVELNMSPLIDMVFILLIFFLVTTSFVKKSAVEVKRPIASNSPIDSEQSNLYITVDKDGYIYIEDQMIDVRNVRSRAERWFADNPMGNVVIMSDTSSRWGVSIEVLGEVQEVGIKNVVVAGQT